MCVCTCVCVRVCLCVCVFLSCCEVTNSRLNVKVRELPLAFKTQSTADYNYIYLSRCWTVLQTKQLQLLIMFLLKRIEKKGKEKKRRSMKSRIEFEEMQSEA